VDRPAEICDSLINLERILTRFVSAETIVIALQTTQHAHASFGEGIALNARHAQESRQVLEMLIEK
jgi:hypothetical protein